MERIRPTASPSTRSRTAIPTPPIRRGSSPPGRACGPRVRPRHRWRRAGSYGFTRRRPGARRLATLQQQQSSSACCTPRLRALRPGSNRIAQAPTFGQLVFNWSAAHAGRQRSRAWRPAGRAIVTLDDRWNPSLGLLLSRAGTCHLPVDAAANHQQTSLKAQTRGKPLGRECASRDVLPRSRRVCVWS